MDWIDAEKDPVKRAELRIQRILNDLEEETGKEIDSVDVDCRNFANLKPEIFFRDTRGQ